MQNARIEWDLLGSNPGLATCQVMLGKLLNLSMPLFPPSRKMDNKQQYLPNKIFIETKTDKCLRHSKHSKNAACHYTFFYNTQGIPNVSQWF